MAYSRIATGSPQDLDRQHQCIVEHKYIVYYVSMPNRLGASHIDSSRSPFLPIPIDKLQIALDTHSFTPYYQQIVDQIRSLINKGKLKQGQTFCSEGEIAGHLGISKMPVRQAFQKLRSEGILVVAKGKRPVIGSGRVPWNFQQLRGFSEEMRRRGLQPSAKLLHMEVRDPELQVAQALKLTPGERVYCVRRLRFVSAEPVAVVTSFLPARLFSGLEKQDLEKQSLYSVFEHVYNRRLQWAEELIGAVNAGEVEARELEAEVGSPLLIIKETTYDEQNVPVEYSVSLLRGDRYTASVISVRKPAVRS
jgi:GntR family transcriptional regulator